ncbi:hypothetical protein AB0D57_17625 [Streptomyces sp. NPDC048275]|uniref:hypothetical protein n=1 Tax=Streptomyces sp. NPDC048275 TaxID=3155629 RepID=UPI0033D07C9D
MEQADDGQAHEAEKQGGWGKGSKVMRRYREDDDGFTENALHGVLQDEAPTSQPRPTASVVPRAEGLRFRLSLGGLIEPSSAIAKSKIKSDDTSTATTGRVTNVTPSLAPLISAFGAIDGHCRSHPRQTLSALNVAATPRAQGAVEPDCSPPLREGGSPRPIGAEDRSLTQLCSREQAEPAATLALPEGHASHKCTPVPLK